MRLPDPEATSRDVRMARRSLLRCSLCPPHRNENRKNPKAHGRQKSKKRIRRGK